MLGAKVRVGANVRPGEFKFGRLATRRFLADVATAWPREGLNVDDCFAAAVQNRKEILVEGYAEDWRQSTRPNVE